MFERFTDRARRVVVLAQEQARTFGHDHIGTEHILLALVDEHVGGVAAKALESLGITADAVRQQVGQVVERGPGAPATHIPFLPEAKHVLGQALQEARDAGDDYIGTEHILLGLIREGHGEAATVLAALGADRDRVRQRITALLAAYRGGSGTAAR
jgi:ATP-dependent Clp protease ATP-binding subunit ClpC